MTAENPTPAELLQQVNAAIYSLLTRKIHSYTLHGVAYTYETLGELRQLRKDLLTEVQDTTGSTRRRVLLADVSRRAD